MKKQKVAGLSVLVFGLLGIYPPVWACTNILVSKGASQDGSVMITYAADSHTLYGELYHWPAGRHPKDAQVDVYEWDTGKYLGKIKQKPVTYSVVGNMNEHQVAIAETTFEARAELVNPKASMDYGSLIYLALQRSQTAREAIRVMADLTKEYGYCSHGESFSIADPEEVWIMEMVGKGPEEKGAVWVARRVPDGYVTAHANSPRIGTFPLNDKKNCLYSEDVISFAKKKGYYKGKDRDFHFAASYAPKSFGALRFCEARVWNIFRRVAPSLNISGKYLNQIDSGYELPLWIKPDSKLSVSDVMALMRDHFEGTQYDLSKGVGAGPFNLPYRWRPMTYKVGKDTYLNERAVSTQQTAFSFVSQSRSWLPGPIGGILWFGVDDTYSTVYIPMYAGITKIPKNFRTGVGSFKQFSWDSAFWVFNFVSNFAYSRYRDMIQDIQKHQIEFESSFFAKQDEVEKAALKLYDQAPALARDYLTTYSAEQARRVVKRFRNLLTGLLMKYLDGNVRDEHGKVTHPPYPDEWYEYIVKEKGELIKMKKLKGEIEPTPTPKCECNP